MTLRHCRVCDEFHSVHGWPSPCRGHFASRGPKSDLPCPSIRTDGMDPIQSMTDGKTYDSRSAYYASIKQAGCEIVGNDSSYQDTTPREFVPDPIVPDIKRAIEELSSR